VNGYAEHLHIDIQKVFRDGEFSHWEVDVSGPKGEFVVGATGPTFYGMIDMACGDAARESLGNWMESDANERKLA
jgi:hypothetical protein